MQLYWWSIEVLDGASGPARAWRDAHGEALSEAAITNGAYDWEWHQHTWGVLFEIAFATDEHWHVFRDLPVVRAALDAAPHFLVYPGRGGSSGRTQPRRPRPIAGAGAAALPISDPPIAATALSHLAA